ncbi:Pyridoxal phosphate-dependent transferase, subdomain 2,Pyridoxal phosphate-dependent transferase [Cinara cedri]|uniref:cystathionine gamma-lyase n=1 Tax=Cinara cedri TaxID=506608 RepID=A0A5E4MPC1_9HEMI|nr:Pyridoxal phosphate-dependent transferase, subdomain 2,Pyridoxal phosphate-dependent transferase [Cinara cedri]
MADDKNPQCQQKIDPHFGTKAIHAGQNPDQWTFKDVVPPIALTTTYKQYGPNDHAGFEYTRCGNPIRKVLQECIASLEDAKHCLTYASGLAATTATIQLLKAGDHVVCGDDMYGGTNRYFRNIASKFGLKFTMIDMTDLKNVENAILPETKLVWLESPTNPLMRVSDLKAIATFAHKFREDILVVVDNTFQTAYFQKPLQLGADIVLYSLSKYMNGHSDVIMGALVINDTPLFDSLAYIQNSCGIMSSPFDCYLVNRGLKTLHVRMKEHMRNGLAVARFLEQHPLVESVMHPGLPSHPQHAVAVRQCSGFSGMLSFYIKGGLDEATRFLQAIRVFCLAESLGGFESLADHPALMTHASVPPEERKALRISDNLIRLSVGIESEEDLIADLDQALKASVQK